MKEIDGVRQIGGLKKEISDAMGKPEHRGREWGRTLR